MERQGTLRIARAQMKLLIECPGVAAEETKLVLNNLISSIQSDESNSESSKMVSLGLF